MSKLRRQLSVGTSNTVETKNLNDIKEKTGNLYESIAIIAKRANQINITLIQCNFRRQFVITICPHIIQLFGLCTIWKCF